MSLRKITRAIDLNSRQLAANFQLTGPQLICLREISRSGSIAPSALASTISLSHPTVTGILDRLEKRELCVRIRQTDDRRRVLIELTEEGKRLAEIAPAPLHQRFADRLTNLTSEEQARIDQVLSLVVEMMETEVLEVDPEFATAPLDKVAPKVAEFVHKRKKTNPK
jgi:DNA-binding MarR family transcriptional regulator